jgi:hypothetical protein
MDLVLQVGELDARLTSLLCKRFFRSSKKVKTGPNVAEFSKKDYGSKRAMFACDDDDDYYYDDVLEGCASTAWEPFRATNSSPPLSHVSSDTYVQVHRAEGYAVM